MEYVISIYESETTRDQQDMKALMSAYVEYTQALEKAGVLRGGNPLQPVATATTVRVRDGKAATTDGPFAETKEQFGGFYLIECDNLDEAVEWAGKCPSATFGSIEVRPVMKF